MTPEIEEQLRKKYAPLEPFMPRSVFIGIPCHDGQYDVEFSNSLFQATERLKRHGIDYTIHNEGGGGICLARQEICYAFMTGHSECLFFLDSDLNFEPDLFMHVLTCPADISVGVYPLKKLNFDKLGECIQARDECFAAKSMEYPIAMLEKHRHGAPQVIDIPGFVEVEQAATGFMRIKRKVIGMMQLNHPELEYKNDLQRSQYALFNNRTKICEDRCTRIFQGEDYAFCNLARQDGFKIYADLKYGMGHVGRYKFEGHFGKAMMNSNANKALQASIQGGDTAESK